MALNTQLPNIVVNAQADAYTALLANGYCRIYSGTQPATGDTALSGNTLLAELRFGATAAPAAVAGVITFNAITQDASADASGTPTFYRLFKSDGTSAAGDGTVGTSGCNLNLVVGTITAGQPVSVTSFTHTVAKSTSGS